MYSYYGFFFAIYTTEEQSDIKLDVWIVIIYHIPYILCKIVYSKHIIHLTYTGCQMNNTKC